MLHRFFNLPNKKIILLIILAISISLGFIFYFSHEIIHHFLPWRVQRFAGYLDKGSLFDLRTCLCLPDKDINLIRDDGLNVAASLYGIKGSHLRPAIVLVHGNTPLGRKLALYRVLSERLAKRGYIVLAIDQTGFGESGDPFSLNSNEALDNDKDVYAALNYLEGLKIVDKTKIYIIGHSGGAIPAFNVAVKDSRINKIVAIGPPRRVKERLQYPSEVDYFWNRFQINHEEVYGKEVPTWFTKELFLNMALSYDMERFIPYFAKSLHKSFLLIDGERENTEDKEYLKNYFLRISEPKDYKTISNADHYLNTIGIKGVIFYDKKVIEEVVLIIDQWLLN